MRMTFKAQWLKEWTLTDDRLIYGDEVIKLNEITHVSTFAKASRMTNGVITVRVGAKDYTLAYPFKQKAEGEQAAEYLMQHYKDPGKQEFRMRCNVCGKLFCFTMNDMRQNIANLENAKKYAARSAFCAISGAELSRHANMSASDRYIDRIVDYSRCPNCNSTDTILIEEINTNIATPALAPASPLASVADEIKQLKELLDLGILTQEEFDAKKKQLLDL